LHTFDGKAFFFFIQRSVELRVILSGVGKKPLLGHDAPERRLSQNLGQYFLHRAIEDCGPRLFVSPSLAVTVSRVSCRPCLQFSLFVKLFHIKITFNKENSVLESASVIHRDFVG